MIYQIKTEHIPRIRHVGRIKYEKGWHHTSSTLRSNVLFVMVKGCFCFHTEQEDVRLTDKSTLFFPSGTAYSVDAEEDCDYFYLHLYNDLPLFACTEIDFSAQLTTKAYKSALDAVGVSFADRISLSERPEDFQQLLLWLTECEQTAYSERAYATLDANAAAIRILCLLGEITHKAYRSTQARPAMLRMIAQFIQANYTKHITLSDLCDEFQVSKQYVMRLFKKHYGISPTSYIIRVKMEKGKKLLKYTVLNVEEVSFSLGYPSYYFCRLFKRTYGYTPSEYRCRALEI